jgi:hypothetical protein
MLAQLPPHTVAKKINNYEHLDLLWGQDVDKDVFPHVLEYLETYAEPVKGAKSQEAKQNEEITPSPPAYSKSEPSGLRKREVATQSEPRVSYAEAAAGDVHLSAERKPGLSYAKVAAERPENSSSSDTSDSDQTIGEEEHDARVQPNVSFADVAKVGIKGEKEDAHEKVQEPGDHAPGIDKYVSPEVSYADMASK